MRVRLPPHLLCLEVEAGSLSSVPTRVWKKQAAPPPCDSAPRREKCRGQHCRDEKSHHEESTGRETYKTVSTFLSFVGANANPEPWNRTTRPRNDLDDQVPLSIQSEQLSRGRKVFEELSSFAK